MSTGEKAYGLLKSIMLMTERFDALDAKIGTVAADQAALGKSHSDLALRVAEIEGYLRAATGTAFGDKPRLERK